MEPLYGALVVTIFVVACAVLNAMKTKYFSSEEFIARKRGLQRVVEDHNNLAQYLLETKERGFFDLGSSETGKFSHLAHGVNTSKHKYKRDRNTISSAPNVHECSLQVVTRAQREPIKYLMKYFGISADERTLRRVEAMGQSFYRLEGVARSLEAHKGDIVAYVNPPAFIKLFFMDDLVRRVGAKFPEVKIPYPKYVFEYVSAGGNSSQRTEIVLNPCTMDALVQVISDKIKWRKSVSGQRALMTSGLRREIANRDKNTCQKCGVSVRDEPHLLLEIDHIIPVSKGGLTVRENLQALCWRCNRSKSNKLTELGPSPA